MAIERLNGKIIFNFYEIGENFDNPFQGALNYFSILFTMSMVLISYSVVMSFASIFNIKIVGDYLDMHILSMGTFLVGVTGTNVPLFQHPLGRYLILM